MLIWSHYSFRQLLNNKAELYNEVHVLECIEPYTCGQCGELNYKVFKCKHCGYIADRDVNGVRNILLRYLSLFYMPVWFHADGRGKLSNNFSMRRNNS